MDLNGNFIARNFSNQSPDTIQINATALLKIGAP